MKKKHRNNFLHWYDAPENEEIAKRKSERFEQARIRLEQQERHIAVQEEKNRLRKEAIAREKAEAVATRAKKFFRIFSITNIAKAAVGVTTSVATLMFILRQLGTFNPDARELYFSLANKLNSFVSKAIYGGTVTVEAFNKAIDKVISIIKRRK